jgi:hypothetical protein
VPRSNAVCRGRPDRVPSLASPIPLPPLLPLIPAASQRTTSPLLRKEWPPRSPFIRITESELLDVIEPRYNQRNKAILTCLAANGTIRTTLTPNSDLNLQNGYRVETLGPFGEAAPGARRNLTFLYYPVEPLPTNGRVFAFFFIQNECTVPGVTEPARPVRSRATLVVTKDACWGCLENCVRGEPGGARLRGRLLQVVWGTGKAPAWDCGWHSARGIPRLRWQLGTRHA